MSTTTEKYTRVAADFTDRVARCCGDQWSSSSPCDGWSAGDVVRHVIGVHRRVLAEIGVMFDDGPASHGAVEVDNESLLGRWTVTRDRLLAAMNDPALAGAPVNGPMGPMPFKQLAGTIVLHDLLVHTWDLAVATGQSTQLDAEAVAVALERMTPLNDFLRSPEMFGPAITPPEGADVQTRFVCFVGRSPIA
jgi:uncharacterized protein (TIGR03086 family)